MVPTAAMSEEQTKVVKVMEMPLPQKQAQLNTIRS